MKDKYRKWINIFERLKIFFFWIWFFYPKSKGTPVAYLLFTFVPQKIFRINGKVPWAVHFTSRLLNYENIQVGNFSNPGLNSGCYVQGKNGILIGHNLRMGPNVGIISANHDPNDYDKWLDSDPIKIGNNVWIGIGAVVLPGVEIGDNVIIASNSVVNKNIPSNVIAGGIPCKVIKEKSEYKGIDYSNIQ